MCMCIYLHNTHTHTSLLSLNMYFMWSCEEDEHPDEHGLDGMAIARTADVH